MSPIGCQGSCQTNQKINDLAPHGEGRISQIMSMINESMCVSLCVFMCFSTGVDENTSFIERCIFERYFANKIESKIIYTQVPELRTYEKGFLIAQL